MIDHTRENLFTFAEAAKQLPARKGKHVHVSTLWRWASRGVKGIRLEAIRVGGRWMTSNEALQRFFDAVTRQDDHCARPSTPTRRQRQINQAHARASSVLRSPRATSRTGGAR